MGLFGEWVVRRIAKVLSTERGRRQFRREISKDERLRGPADRFFNALDEMREHSEKHRASSPEYAAFYEIVDSWGNDESTSGRRKYALVSLSLAVLVIVGAGLMDGNYWEVAPYQGSEHRLFIVVDRTHTFDCPPPRCGPRSLVESGEVLLGQLTNGAAGRFARVLLANGDSVYIEQTALSEFKPTTPFGGPYAPPRGHSRVYLRLSDEPVRGADGGTTPDLFTPLPDANVRFAYANVARIAAIRNLGVTPISADWLTGLVARWGGSRSSSNDPQLFDSRVRLRHHVRVKDCVVFASSSGSQITGTLDLGSRVELLEALADVGSMPDPRVLVRVPGSTTEGYVAASAVMPGNEFVHSETGTSYWGFIIDDRDGQLIIATADGVLAATPVSYWTLLIWVLKLAGFGLAFLPAMALVGLFAVSGGLFSGRGCLGATVAMFIAAVLMIMLGNWYATL